MFIIQLYKYAESEAHHLLLMVLTGELPKYHFNTKAVSAVV